MKNLKLRAPGEALWALVAAPLVDLGAASPKVGCAELYDRFKTTSVSESAVTPVKSWILYVPDNVLFTILFQLPLPTQVFQDKQSSGADTASGSMPGLISR